jgi:hypothetical protein
MSKIASVMMVMGTLCLFGLVNYNMSRNLRGASDAAAVHYSTAMARGIANSVADMALAKVSDDSEWRTGTTETMQFFDGTAVYSVKDTTVSGETLIQVVSTGSLGDETSTVILLARPQDAVPPFLKYAVLAHEELKVNGLNNTFRDDFHPSWNANIHSNDKITLDVTNYVLRGFATYTNSITANWAEVIIAPNQNPDGLPVHRLAPVVTIPVFNPDAYSGIATVTYNSDVTLSGNIALGTKSNPAIIYCMKKLYISGTISGYGAFIVKEDIEVKGSILLSSVDPAKSKVGLYTAGKILINEENTTLHAQMFANNEVVVNAKNARIHGSITTRNKATFNAEGIELYYKPALDALTKPFWPVQAPRLVALHRYE